ncbi:conserved virulence factor C family protein [Paenibacillus cymbidii]|uniref:conserved virulence factor C family protein n=1 Tax=Paenibacillus cymbidii TaxID=1639034 RepID=UPI00107FE142|nr:conserved virulence factor C family protein [Paenibacillus cymbidii]
MRIVSIEPTPSPNSMKLNMDESLPAGVRLSFAGRSAADANAAIPDYARRVLAIEGVTGLYHAADFIAVDRHPKADWQTILSGVRDVLGTHETAAPPQPGTSAAANARQQPAEAWGEVNVLVQTFRSIPMQVRVNDGREERRSALPERFAAAAMKAGMASPNLIRERKLEEQGARYGELDDILEQVVRELDAAYDQERLDEMVTQAEMQGEQPNPNPEAGTAAEESALSERNVQDVSRQLDDADWKVRYAALQRIKPTEATLPLLVKALDDANVSIRRLATVYLGDLREPFVLPYLYRALSDASAAVRRTAGDTLSDIGDPSATPAMADALRDANKLVRWRAARFLFEAGDERALEALRAARNETEFEVRMQINMALERIEGGTAASGSVWQQMTNRPRE